jgi:hypothetical protein
MSCKNHKFDEAVGVERCKCKAAVLRAYKGLLSAGQPENNALEAAKIVYAHHHPEDPQSAAALTVERWVHAERLH